MVKDHNVLVYCFTEVMKSNVAIIVVAYGDEEEKRKE